MKLKKNKSHVARTLPLFPEEVVEKKHLINHSRIQTKAPLHLLRVFPSMNYSQKL